MARRAQHPTRADKYRQSLDALVSLLKRAPHDARTLARLAGCSKPTVYARIDALAARGYIVSVEQTRAGKRGPKATVFRVTGEPPARAA